MGVAILRHALGVLTVGRHLLRRAQGHAWVAEPSNASRKRLSRSGSVTGLVKMSGTWRSVLPLTRHVVWFAVGPYFAIFLRSFGPFSRKKSRNLAKFSPFFNYPPSVGGLDLNSSNSGCARLGSGVAPSLGVVKEEVAVFFFGLRHYFLVHRYHFPPLIGGGLDLNSNNSGCACLGSGVVPPLLSFPYPSPREHPTATKRHALKDLAKAVPKHYCTINSAEKRFQEDA